MNSINNNIEEQNTKTMTDLNSENLDNNSIPMNSLTSLKSMENYPKEVNDAFLMNNNSTVKLFKDPKENAHDSYSSFDGKDSITSSMGGENLIQRYSSLKKEYEKLNKKYNESVAANQEKKQKIDELNSVIEELNSKLNLYQKEKEKLEKENDKVFTEKLKLQNDLEILKQKLQLNEYSLNNLKNTINIENKVDNGGDMLETVKIIQEKNEEIRKLGEKVKELEKKNDYMSIGNEQGENINSIKYEDEIKKLKEEFQKEKENYSLIIKVKDEEIQRLVKIKEDISAQEKKKYEGYIAKYEELATEKDVEIETLKLKNKKLSKINKMLKDNSNK